MDTDVFTIGHSTHSIDAFLSLLSMHQIQVIADVRSAPFSKFNPQFNRKEFQRALSTVGIRYVFLGKELGARSDDPACYSADRVQYDRLAKTALFQSGLDRVADGANSYRVAMMCAERDPLECHRTILVARELVKRGIKVTHILADGSLEKHTESIDRLLSDLGLSTDDMFRSPDDVIDDAYAKQADKIAYDRRSHRRTDIQDGEQVDAGKTL